MNLPLCSSLGILFLMRGLLALDDSNAGLIHSRRSSGEAAAMTAFRALLLAALTSCDGLRW